MNGVDGLRIALTLAGGLPFAYAITRRLPLALLLAPLTTALLTTAAAVAMLVAGGALRGWLAGAIAAQCAVAAPLLLRRSTAPLPVGRWADAAWLALPQVPPFLYTLRAPEQWDAHSIWWLHAAYLTQGAGLARQDIANPVFGFSHVDYPPLASAPVAAVWTVLPSNGFRAAQVVSAALTFSAIMMLVYAVRRVTAAAPPLVSRVAAAAVGLAVWSTEPSAVGTGMSDPLWAATCTAGAILLLVGDRPFDRPALPVVLLGTAALTKNEGLVAVAIVALLVTLRHRRDLRRAWPVWLPVAAGLAWTLLARHLGASNDLVRGGHFGDVLRLDPAVLARLRPTFAALGATTGGVPLLAVAVAVLGTVFLRSRRKDLRLGSDGWLWALAGAYAGSLLITYLISPNEIHWHLATSASRVTLPLVLSPCASAACWAAAAVGARRAPARHAAPSSVPRQPVRLR